jgi:ABC-2 type transport system permease protein
MGPLIHLVRKELLLLRRDWHALLLLFLMPTVFILIMSLALRGLFASHGRVVITYALLDQDRSPASQLLAGHLAGQAEFQRIDLAGDEARLQAAVRADQAQFLVRIPAGFGAALLRPQPQAVELSGAPSVEPTLLKLFDASLREAAARVYLKASLGSLARSMGDPSAADALDLDAVNALVASRSLYMGEQRLPSSVQQNVPAWLIFAMFFIAIPLSNTWVQERSHGTYARMLSLGVPRWKLLLGKLLPYLGVNLAQAACMLAVGVYLVPRLGGDALDLGDAPAALALMVLAVSFAAVSWGLLIANVVRTSEQATIFTGVGNLLLGLLGGVMVPLFVMPGWLQAIGRLTPVAWGLEGFLDVFLRRGGLAQVAPRAALLLAFGVAALGLAHSFFKRRSRG